MKKEIDNPEQIKIAAFDLDGTLLWGTGEIQDCVVEGLRILNNNDIITIIATGRNGSQIDKQFLLNTSYLVLCNGALVVDTNTKSIVFEKSICKKDVYIVNSITKANGGRCMLMEGDTITVEYDIEKAIRWFYQNNYPDFKNTELLDSSFYKKNILLNNSHKTRLNCISIMLNPKKVYKIKCFFENKTACNKVSNELLFKSKSNSIEVLVMNDNSIEITAKNVNKAVGLEKIVNYLKYTMMNVVAVGDSENDKEMLEAAGIAVAVGNANNSIKKIVDFVADDANNNGAIKAVLHLLGIKR